MSEMSRKRAQEFLSIADQFKLGVLLTESSHPVTANLSDVARTDVAAALELLFTVDQDVLARYECWVNEGSTAPVAEAVLEALRGGHRIFFTGCGSTGRLSILLESIWRRFWQEVTTTDPQFEARRQMLENSVFSAMAGGDFALIKAVEGFEDFTQFGRRQIADLGIGPGDVLFAITEGGETSWVIGTAWEGLERGATVYFVYNNPDDVLVPHVQRSREVIQEPRIHKINLTTGPMAISGSTRMQATTIQLCVLLTVLEWVVRSLLREMQAGGAAQSAGHRAVPEQSHAPEDFLSELREVMAELRSERLLKDLAELVKVEESVYRNGHRTTYYASALAADVLTDTTERSPTFCTPPFRRYDDPDAADSWTFLTTPVATTEAAWRTLLRREPRCVEWSEEEVRAMTPADKADRTVAIVRRIGASDLMKFRIGVDGRAYRRLGPGDYGIAILAESEASAIGSWGPLDDWFRELRENGAGTAAVILSAKELSSPDPNVRPLVHLRIPRSRLVLRGVERAAVKMLLNALSTCVMVRLGRVMGNTMIWVVASNLKLIDRATRYIARLTGLPYEDACYLLFDSIEYVTPRMAADQVYPPVVGLSVMRARHGVSPEEAERMLWKEIG